MLDYLAVTKALSDEARVRSLLAMRKGELCVCQIVELLGLAPSTVSRHMDVLRQAGLVEMRKEGRWHYYRLAGRDASPMVRRALRWTLEVLAEERVIVRDAAVVCGVRDQDPRALVSSQARA